MIVWCQFLIVLGRFTEEGIKKIKKTKKAQEEAEKLVQATGGKNLDLYYTFGTYADNLVQATGGKILSLYYTMGRYDWVATIQVPSIQKAMKALLMFGQGERNRTETLVAITAAEAVKLIEEIP